MKKGICVFGVIGLFAGALFMGCDITSEQTGENGNGDAGYASQVGKDARAEYLAKWRRFKRYAEQTIKTNENRIDAFREKMDGAGHTFKAKNSRETAILEQRNRSLKLKLGEYHEGGQIKWEEFRMNFNDDLDEVGKSMTVLFRDDR